ncbi:MAG: hypothetical protein WBF77_00960 [Sulfurimonadaceae bacterium]
MFKTLILFVLFSSSLLAVELADNIRLQGFLTVDATGTTAESLGTSLPNGDREILTEGDVSFNHSVFGLQLEIDSTDDLSLAVQGVYTKDAESDSFKPQLEWAYVGYDFGHDFSGKIGRMKVPFLKGIELRYVGYSRLWTRAQIPSSGVNGFDEYDGVDLFYNSAVGEVNLEFELSGGVANHQLDIISDNYLVLAAAQIDIDESWLRITAGYNNFDIIDSNTPSSDNPMYIASVETELKRWDWIINAGYTYTQTDAIPSAGITYGSLAYHFEPLTPYVLYSRRTLDIPDRPAPPPGAPPPPNLEAITLEQHHAIGLRYDVITNVDIKLQYDYQTFDSSENPSAVKTPEADLFTIAVDWVF